MKTCVLSSGSKGNCTYVETSSHKYLFDLGRNLKYITEKLKEINVAPSDIEYIVISHSHDDHISALESFIKKYHPVVIITNEICKNIGFIKNYDNLLIYDDDININDDIIHPFSVSHDSKDAKNFVLDDGINKLAYVTDTGYINKNHFELLTNCDIYLFESNHDIEMLNNGPYPKWLKARVLSDVGHLSNISASVYLAKLIGPVTKKIVLIHLSETNNTPVLALDTIKEIFDEYSINFSNIICAYQNEISEVIEI